MIEIPEFALIRDGTTHFHCGECMRMHRSVDMQKFSEKRKSLAFRGGFYEITWCGRCVKAKLRELMQGFVVGADASRVAKPAWEVEWHKLLGDNVKKLKEKKIKPKIYAGRKSRQLTLAAPVVPAGPPPELNLVLGFEPVEFANSTPSP